MILSIERGKITGWALKLSLRWSLTTFVFHSIANLYFANVSRLMNIKREISIDNYNRKTAFVIVENEKWNINSAF